MNLISEYYPNPNGTITLEWENEDGDCLFIEIGNHSFSYFVEINNEETLYFNNMSIHKTIDIMLLIFCIRLIHNWDD